jgi:18S rRNA (guanine1575-N7)-methyltransferase
LKSFEWCLSEIRGVEFRQTATVQNTLPRGLEDVNDSSVVRVEDRIRVIGRGKAKKSSKKDRDWIIRKKETYRKKGKEGVPRDSK